MSFDSKEVSVWKKVFETDLANIVVELQDTVSDPSVIILSGPVGAGKTTFTKHFFDEETMSPTYSIINESEKIVHADFYRLKSRDEIIHLELPMYMEDKSYFLVEWGRDYALDIFRELGDSFKYYELELSVNDKVDNSDHPSRNFSLKEIFF
jgi:tRNA threonylcarbamoyladenosine biosynthesis protein TsaE